MYQSRNIGKIKIEHSNDFAPKVLSKAAVNDFNKGSLGDYSSWHIVDPDKGYDFTIRSERLRDGGSRTLDIYGNSFPQEWKQNTGIIRYNGFGNDDGSAQKRRDALNNIFKAYGLQFD